MATDRHQLWRLVEHDYDQLAKGAPEGYEPFVLVHLVGRPTPVEIGFVETRDADAGGTLVRFEALNRHAGERPGRPAHPEDYWVHVPGSSIERVEIHFRPTEDQQPQHRRPVGFVYPEDTSSD